MKLCFSVWGSLIGLALAACAAPETLSLPKCHDRLDGVAASYISRDVLEQCAARTVSGKHVIYGAWSFEHMAPFQPVHTSRCLIEIKPSADTRYIEMAAPARLVSGKPPLLASGPPVSTCRFEIAKGQAKLVEASTQFPRSASVSVTIAR